MAEQVVDPIYHAGELAVQAEAGLSEQAQLAALLIHSKMPRIAREFLARQRMVIVSTRDAQGQVWASAVTGPAGFIKALDSQTLEVTAHPTVGDPLLKNLRDGVPVGLFILEFSTRMRMKAKGHCEILAPGRFRVHVARVYSQCKKYIQARVLLEDSPQPVEEREVSQGESLTSVQQEWIRKADTFFIASFHPDTGTDAAHRGGNPGFVQVVDERTLVFPNYYGNTMFNTLGNISLDPHAGLLFLDFAAGTTLQVTGTATVVWDKERIAKVPGANQLVEYRVSRTIETPHALPLRWRFVAYSAANPG